MKRIFLPLIILCLCISCERQSGRKTGRVTRPNTLHDQSSKTRASRIANTNKPKTGSNKVVMSGPEIFEKYNSAVFMIFTSDGFSDFQGSGFFISDNGIAVSNYHVFKGTTRGLEIIKLSNGNEFKVKDVISYDDDEDYILFRVEIGNQKVNYIPLESSSPKIGEKVYAIGSPRGLENTFSSGEISQIREKVVLQISVPIDHGSSGGALINSYGEVIGITSSGYDGSSANLNFAMSIKVIKKHLLSVSKINSDMK